jgi:hypothetical protein
VRKEKFLHNKEAKLCVLCWHCVKRVISELIRRERSPGEETNEFASAQITCSALFSDSIRYLPLPIAKAIEANFLIVEDKQKLEILFEYEICRAF